MRLQERLCTWENLELAYQNAARGKRGKGTTYPPRSPHFKIRKWGEECAHGYQGGFEMAANHTSPIVAL